MTALIIGLVFALPLPTETISQTYTTDFEATENPISEDGSWLNGKTDGLDWSDIATDSGSAHGTNTTVRYSDPTAVLKGTWAADQEAEDQPLFETSRSSLSAADSELTPGLPNQNASQQGATQLVLDKW